MSRRSFGSIRKLTSGRWQVRYRTPDGTRHSAPMTFKTKSDANAYLSDVESDLRRDAWIDPRLREQPAGPWIRQYVESLSHLKPRSEGLYDSLLRCWIMPTFEKMPIGSIRPSTVRMWVSDMATQGLGASRTRQAYYVFGASMKAAVLDGVITATPCIGVKLPRIPETALSYLLPKDVHRLAGAMPEPFGLFVDILAFGGLRFGEAAALRRSRCETLLLHVQENLVENDGELQFGSPKDHQIRTTDIPASLGQAIAKHLETIDSSPDALLFTSPDGGPLQYSNFMTRIWHPTVEKVELTATPHLLRHTCASLLLNAGASVRDLQAHLGHASPQITLKTYSALIEGRSADLALRLDDLWAETKGTQRAQDVEIKESEGVADED